MGLESCVKAPKSKTLGERPYSFDSIRYGLVQEPKSINAEVPCQPSHRRGFYGEEVIV